jgi:hypothetical protein
MGVVILKLLKDMGIRREFLENNIDNGGKNKTGGFKVPPVLRKKVFLIYSILALTTDAICIISIV